MKLRRQPEDFCVEERTTFPLGAQGPYAVYRLSKKHWTTLDALDRLSRWLRVPRKSIDHAGMKDRHAVTSQLISIRHGPRRSDSNGSLDLEYLGQSTRPVRPEDIRANAFRIVLRSLSLAELQLAEHVLPQIQQTGIPNYFDDQRFGSYVGDQGFIAAAWIREDYERALQLTFAESTSDDDAAEKVQKQILRDHWGDWTECKRLLSRSHRRSIVTYLCDKPHDFKGAWGRVRGELRGLYLSALQSDLWNAIADLFLRRHCRPEQLISLRLKTGNVHLFQSLDEDQLALFQNTRIPLPSARLELDTEPLRELISDALQTRGWKLNELKVKYPRDRFFFRSQRDLVVPVQELSWESGEDELDPGRRKLTLSFVLPRGGYATLLVKRLMIGDGRPLELGSQNVD